MVRRTSGAVVAVVGLAALALVGSAPACYDSPLPDCGFQCGTAGSCPDDYTCSATSICRSNSAPVGTVCAGPVIDAAPDDELPDSDAPINFDSAGSDAPLPDARVTIDAEPDAMPDAAPDAMPDAAPDAMPDAMPDAPPVDAMPDAP